MEGFTFNFAIFLEIERVEHGLTNPAGDASEGGGSKLQKFCSLEDSRKIIVDSLDCSFALGQLLSSSHRTVHYQNWAQMTGHL